MPYAPIINEEDIYSRIYEEVVEEITREEGSITTRAIEAAIGEVKMYLSKYDLVKLFGDETEGIAATFTDTFLKNLCVDVAVWRLVLLGNPTIKYEVAKSSYEMALSSLKSIQKGQADPRWPYQETTGETAPNGNAIYHTSNRRRKYHL